METITCPNCSNDIRLGPSDRPPPWCPRCGADIRPRPTAPVVPVAAPTRAPAEVVLTPGEAERPVEPEVFVERPEDLTEGRTYRRAYREMGGGQAGFPGWVWLFVAACLLLSVVTLGGVVPIGLSLAGAVVCVLTGRSRTEDDYGKLCYCGGTTILVWIIGFGTALLASVR